MAISKVVIASILLSLLLLNGVQSIPTNELTNNDMKKTRLPQDCGVLCGRRCSLSRRPHLCKRACGTCCRRCSCVPPGTYGNYDACPCYAKLTTRGNKRKCP